MIEWATFHGSAEDLGDQFKLIGAGENGIILLPKNCVSFEHHKISVKIGARAIILQQAQGMEEATSYVPEDECRQRQYVGLVEFCCDGRVLGPCRIPVHV